MAEGRLDRNEVEGLVARAKALAQRLEFVEAPALDEDQLHAYGRRRTGEALRRLLAEDVERLAAAVRRLGEEAAASREEAERARSKRDEPARSGGDGSEGGAAPPEAESLGGLLSAPFRVSPAVVSAAKNDPLLALAVQVARALGDDAKEVERARLIAMAFAASRGDMEAFWTARRQRTTGGAKKTTRAK
jgi:hypothetical protein